MPKEKVRSRYHKDNGFEHYQPKTSDDHFVQVGWQKAGSYVEVASVNPHGALETELGSIDTPTPGWSVGLDRKGINELIRHLRKARDDAFGRDE